MISKDHADRLNALGKYSDIKTQADAKAFLERAELLRADFQAEEAPSEVLRALHELTEPLQFILR